MTTNGDSSLLRVKRTYERSNSKKRKRTGKRQKDTSQTHELNRLCPQQDENATILFISKLQVVIVGTNLYLSPMNHGAFA